MTYRNRVFILLTSVALCANGALLATTHWKFREILLEEIRSHVLSITATTAAFLEPDLQHDFHTRDDEASPAYQRLQQRMRRARDVNRRDDIYVRYIYTLRSSQQKPGAIEFGVDAEENPEQVSHVGDIYEYEGEPIVLGKPYANRNFTRDQWGEWMSALAPMRDGDGRLVASLGVDVDARDVRARLREILMVGLMAMMASIPLAFVAAMLLAQRVTRPLYAVRSALERIERGDFDARLELDSRDEFGELARTLNGMAKALKERETLKSAFARYVSRQVMENILSSDGKPNLRGDRRTVTVLFSDIRDFTRIAEGMPPEGVVQFLNEYFARMITIIFKHKGTLDKFLGDGIMAIFGAPIDDPEHEKHAVLAALEMQAALGDLCQIWVQEGREPIRIGIGIHSGEAIVGNIGSDERMEYTAIGDTVNLASRLESVTKELGVDILISERTLQGVKDTFQVARQGPIQVKGRAAPVETYVVKGLRIVGEAPPSS